jgi:hypothetical protein
MLWINSSQMRFQSVSSVCKCDTIPIWAASKGIINFYIATADVYDKSSTVYAVISLFFSDLGGN